MAPHGDGIGLGIATSAARTFDWTDELLDDHERDRVGQEHALALAEEPRAEAWLDSALRAVLTVFPHWAGWDGGWAEGTAYLAGGRS